MRAGGQLDERALRRAAGPRRGAVRVLGRAGPRQPRPVLRHRAQLSPSTFDFRKFLKNSCFYKILFGHS